jgi:predicted AlkP superfamily pyrophosphatase or phosphodiesterase
MHRFFVLAILVLCACGSNSGTPTPKTKHALIVGIDGLRVDALQEAATPEIDSLIAAGTVTYDAFAGGELGEATQQPTFSGGGWSSVLTGVWVDKHGVMFHAFDDANFDAYPHFFGRVREMNPNAYLSSFVTWTPINESILPSGDPDEAFSPEADDSAEGDIAVTVAVVAHLGSQTPDVLFVHLDEVDHQGHVSGYSITVPEYMNAIETVDAQIGQILEALRTRETYDAEDWLVVVTSDHGGTGVSHGGQSDEERTISLIVNGGSVVGGETISPGPGHTAVPPTVMKHLGLEVDPDWGWESAPFGL